MKKPQPKGGDQTTSFLFYQCNHSPTVVLLDCHSATLGYILQGSLVVIDNNRAINIYEQEIYLLSEGTHIMQYRPNGKAPYSEIRVSLDSNCEAVGFRTLAAVAELPLPTSATTTNSCVHERATPLVCSYFVGLTHYATLSLMSHNPAYRRMKLNELMLLLFDNPQSVVATALWHNSRPTCQTTIERVVVQQLTHNPTIEQLAQMCDMKPSTFKSTFRRLFGDSPHHWMLMRRLEKVEHLLRCGDAPIKYICYECGFGSPSQMIRHFRSAYGTTPTKYRSFYNAQLGNQQEGEMADEVGDSATSESERMIKNCY